MKLFRRCCVFLIFLMTYSLHSISELPFNKVVIWGHKLHSHTHSYIHDAFYKAFRYLGYDTYWFDDNDNTKGFDFENCLFLTEGQVQKNIPLVSSSYYLLHNCDRAKYKRLLDSGHAIAFQVYTHRCKDQHSDIQKIQEYIYSSKSGKVVYMPWATDLLPDEIEKMEKKVKENWNNKKERVVYWVGTIGGGLHGNVEQINSFKAACIKDGIQFKHLTKISSTENKKIIFDSYCAPTLVGRWQVDEGYIPCRIFKNISYGQFGMTNSRAVYDLFEQKIVYNPDAYQLFYDGAKKMKELTLQEMLDLMHFVKIRHTYINRIELLVNFLKECLI